MCLGTLISQYPDACNRGLLWVETWNHVIGATLVYLPCKQARDLPNQVSKVSLILDFETCFVTLLASINHLKQDNGSTLKNLYNYRKIHYQDLR